MNKHTRYKLRHGLHRSGVAYKVLTHNVLKVEDRRLVAKTVITLTTPVEAKKLVGHKSPWGYTPLNPTPGTRPKEAGVVTFKGVEVALFFKRATDSIFPSPEDPMPEGILEHPEDVWVRFDLTGLSARQLSQTVRQEFAGMTHEIAVMQTEIATLEGLLDSKGHAIATLQGRVAELEKKLKTKKEKGNK